MEAISFSVPLESSFVNLRSLWDNERSAFPNLKIKRLCTGYNYLRRGPKKNARTVNAKKTDCFAVERVKHV